MPYIVCFLFSVIFAKFSDHYRDKNRMLFCFFSVVSIMIPTLLAGLRDTSVGTDVMGYIVPDYRIAHYYTDVRSFIEYILVRRNREIGYSIIIFIASRIGSPNWALFFLQLITMVCVYLGVQKRSVSISPAFFLMLYFLLFYMNSYNIMRQMVAVAIIFYGSLYIEEGRYFRFLPYVVIAVLFHWSALCSIVFIPIHIVAKKGWKFQVVFALGVAFVFIAINYFTQDVVYVVKGIRLFQYINGFSQKVNSSQTIESITYLLIMFSLILIAKVMKKITKNYSYNLMISYALVAMIFSSAIIPSIRRLTYYFALINLPVVCQIPDAFGNTNSKNIIRISILFYALAFWIFMFVVAGSGGVMPYRSILE